MIYCYFGLFFMYHIIYYNFITKLAYLSQSHLIYMRKIVVSIFKNENHQ